VKYRAKTPKRLNRFKVFLDFVIEAKFLSIKQL